MTPFSRREFLGTAGSAVLGSGFITNTLIDAAENEPPLLKAVHEQIVCPWTPRHPRHDHQLIFPLDDSTLMLVWSEYYSTEKTPQSKPGQAGATDDVSCQITSIISKDRGRTWSDRKVIQPNNWKHNVKHPNLIRVSNTEILFSYVGWDSDSARNVYMRRSTDNGQSWGQQIQISEPGWYCNNADRAIRLKSGRILLPAHGPFADTYIGDSRYQGGNLHSFVFFSDDGFQTWKRSANSMTAPGRGCHEPTIVELKDGRLYCLLRNTNQKQYVSYSKDQGEHWSQPKPTTLKSPESPAIIKRIPTTGDLLVIWNNVASRSNWPRTPLTAAISTDEGQTWTHFKDIDNRADHDAAYPSVTFVGDDALVTYYTRPTRWKRDSEVMLKIFNLEQFYE